MSVNHAKTNTTRRAAAPYRSRPTKRRTRRSGADIAKIRKAIHRLVAEDHPMTVRQIFYRLVSEGVIEKTEAQYKSTVVRLTTEMRLAGDLPFTWIADETRFMRKPRTFESIERSLQISVESFRRDFWQDQPHYCEIWLEKDALSGIISQETFKWDVPLMVTRGYPSLSFVHSAAMAIAHQRKPTTLYYFGDYDPSGADISRHLEARIRELAPKAVIDFRRVAVLPEQIERWKLPTRPTKRTDSRAKNFEGESVELDAIPPHQLRSMARQCIERLIDREQLQRAKQIEAEEKKGARMFLDKWQQATGGGEDG